MISHFNENTDFTLKQIEKLGEDTPLNTDGLDIQIVSKNGETFDLPSSVVEGKFTIVDFYADWCVPCKFLEKELVNYMQKHSGIALRKVNIVTWESEVAKQHLAGVNGIPYVIIFDASGKEVFRGAGAIGNIRKLIESGD